MRINTFIFIIISTLLIKAIAAQDNASNSKNDSIYSFIDQPPEFPGGITGIGNYLELALNYPKQAINDSIEGKVYIGFVVETNGSVSNVNILRGIGGGCDEEAKRVISEMPNWNPGKHNGKTVRVSKTLPIDFSLAIPPPSQTKIYLEVDSVPEFVGGIIALDKYLAKNIADNERIIDSSIVAQVNVYFIIEINGSVSNVFVKDTTENKLIEKAINIIEKMPAWKPGKIGTTNVRTLVHLPVDFSVFSVVEKMPEYLGGIGELMKFLATNIKYPMQAKNNGIQGRVFINFIVEGDGTVTNIRVLRGIGGGCDEEAVRIVSLMPDWEPGMQKGVPVRVSYNLPIKFTLQGPIRK